MDKTLVLVYNFPHQIMGIRARNLFPKDAKIVCRASNNIVDTLRFVWISILFQPKIIYAMDIGIPSYFAAVVMKILTFGRVRVIIDTGDLVYLFSKAERKYGKFTLEIIHFTEDAFIKLADRMVVRAPYHKIYLEQNYGKKDIEYLPDGVDLNRFKPVSAKQVRRDLGIDGYFVMGVMGNLFWIDDWNWCYGYYELAALAKLKDAKIKFLVVGDGRGLDKLKERAKELGVENQVIFTGRVSHDKVNEYLNAMDIFVFTQPHHLQTKIRTCAKLPELLAAGCFIFSTDLDEPEKFIGNNGVIVPFKGLKDPLYHLNLASAIRKVYNNRSILSRGTKNRKTAQKYFAYPVLQKKLKVILEKKFK